MTGRVTDETDRQTDRERERETDRRIDRQTQRERERERERKKTNRHTDGGVTYRESAKQREAHRGIHVMEPKSACISTSETLPCSYSGKRDCIHFESSINLHLMIFFIPPRKVKF